MVIVPAPSRGLAAPELAAASRKRRWAHQDSNLERAGYEPAALTVELWARTIVTKKPEVRRRKKEVRLLSFTPTSGAFVLRRRSLPSVFRLLRSPFQKRFQLPRTRWMAQLARRPGFDFGARRRGFAAVPSGGSLRLTSLARPGGSLRSVRAYVLPSRKAFSFRERDGWRSLRSALVRFWRSPPRLRRGPLRRLA